MNYKKSENEKDYPRVKTLRKNSYYAGLLQNIYAGTDSELSSFLQFKYQTNILLGFNDDIAKIFLAIASDEEKHMEILSNCILMTGEDPIYANSQGKWFGGRSVDYVKDIRQMISLNIESKEKFLIDYRTIISKIENNEIKMVLKRIVKDEENHKKLLTELLKNLP